MTILLVPLGPVIVLLLPSHSMINCVSEHGSFRCVSLRQREWEACLYSWSPSSGRAPAAVSPPEAECSPAPADYQGCQLYWTFVRTWPDPLSNIVTRNGFALCLSLALTGINPCTCRWGSFFIKKKNPFSLKIQLKSGRSQRNILYPSFKQFCIIPQNFVLRTPMTIHPWPLSPHPVRPEWRFSDSFVLAQRQYDQQSF